MTQGFYPVDAPPPVAAAHGILDTARIVPEANDYWINGVALWPYPGDLPAAYDPCATGSAILAKGSGTPATTEQDYQAFTVYVPETCTTRITAEIDEEFRRRVTVQLAATEGWYVEREFEQSTRMGTANEHLASADAANAAPADTGVTPRLGLGYLERAIANQGSAGVIHAPVEIVTAWMALGHVFEDSTGILLTKAKNTPVVAGSGYQGVAPIGKAANTGTQLVAYATPPVDLRRSEMFVMPTTQAEAINRSTNNIVYRAERYYAYDWDAARLHAYVRIDWAT